MCLYKAQSYFLSKTYSISQNWWWNTMMKLVWIFSITICIHMYMCSPSQLVFLLMINSRTRFECMGEVIFRHPSALLWTNLRCRWTHLLIHNFKEEISGTSFAITNYYIFWREYYSFQNHHIFIQPLEVLQVFGLSVLLFCSLLSYRVLDSHLSCHSSLQWW